MYPLKNKMLIGIIGKIGSGKTTSAEWFKSKGYVEYMMAGPLKEIGKIMGFSHEQVYGTQEQKLEIHEDWGVSAREFLQKFGTEVCRDFMPTIFPSFNRSIWVYLMEKYVKEHPEQNIVISDVRYENEVEAIKKLGGVLIRIIRPSYDKTGVEGQHKSEQSIDKLNADVTVSNCGTLGDLYGFLTDFRNIHCIAKEV